MNDPPEPLPYRRPFSEVEAYMNQRRSQVREVEIAAFNAGVTLQQPDESIHAARERNYLDTWGPNRPPVAPPVLPRSRLPRDERMVELPEMSFRNPLAGQSPPEAWYAVDGTIMESKGKLLLIVVLLSVTLGITLLDRRFCIPSTGDPEYEPLIKPVFPTHFDLGSDINASLLVPGTDLYMLDFGSHIRVNYCPRLETECVTDGAYSASRVPCNSTDYELQGRVVSFKGPCCMVPCSGNPYESLSEYPNTTYTILREGAVSVDSVPQRCRTVSKLECSPDDLNLLSENAAAYAEAGERNMESIRRQISALQNQYLVKWAVARSEIEVMNGEYIQSVKACEEKLTELAKQLGGGFWDRLGLAFDDPAIVEGCSRPPPIGITAPEVDFTLITDERSFTVPACAQNPNITVQCEFDKYDFPEVGDPSVAYRAKYELAKMVLDLLTSLQLAILVLPVVGTESDLMRNKLKKLLSFLVTMKVPIAVTILIISNVFALGFLTDIWESAKLIATQMALCGKPSAFDKCITTCASTVTSTDAAWNSYCDTAATGILGAAGRDHCLGRPRMIDCSRVCSRLIRGYDSCLVLSHLWPYDTTCRLFVFVYLLCCLYYPQLTVKSYSPAVAATWRHRYLSLEKTFRYKIFYCGIVLTLATIPEVYCGKYQALVQVSPILIIIAYAVGSTSESLGRKAK